MKTTFATIDFKIFLCRKGDNRAPKCTETLTFLLKKIFAKTSHDLPSHIHEKAMENKKIDMSCS